jgi:rRNA maturation endonuclease Nob1
LLLESQEWSQNVPYKNWGDKCNNCEPVRPVYGPEIAHFCQICGPNGENVDMLYVESGYIWYKGLYV